MGSEEVLTTGPPGNAKFLILNDIYIYDFMCVCVCVCTPIHRKKDWKERYSAYLQ